MQDNEHADFDVFVLFTDCGLSILPKIFQVECQLGDEDPESVNHLNFSYNCLFHGLAFINLYFVNVLFYLDFVVCTSNRTSPSVQIDLEAVGPS